MAVNTQNRCLKRLNKMGCTTARVYYMSSSICVYSSVILLPIRDKLTVDNEILARLIKNSFNFRGAFPPVFHHL